VSAVAGLVLVASGCAKPAPQPVQPPARDRVVLAADPETGEVGRVTVTTSGGQVELVERGASTTVTAGGAPTPPSPMPDAEIQRMFGAALAVQPPAARRFDLYFETGGDTLTADSKAQVPDVLAAVKGRVAPEVSVIGHTDTTGAAGANVALGLRRATLIRDLLLQAGLDASLVDVASHGESNLLVQTPDSTAEARNRRVEVTVR
jgi:outer membrane protein OmpA-like peptidoglycan-associated protein